MSGSVTVVIATRDRRASLARTLARLGELAGPPPVIVVDNGSLDGTPEWVRQRHPRAGLIVLGRNIGAAARTAGVRRAQTPYVALCDDDSWWDRRSLERAADALDRHSRLALVAAHVLVGPEGRTDPVSEAMAASPLRHTGPGPGVLGFLACGAVVRRSAYLAVGGFHDRFGVGGEEQLLAIDLARAGWDLAYLPEVVARHHPHRAPRPGRRRAEVRNHLWCAWLRRPLPSAVAITAQVAAGRCGTRAGFLDALRGLRWVAAQRQVVGPALEAELRLLEEAAVDRTS